MFPKKLFEGWRRRQKGSFQSQAFETHEEHRMSWRGEKRKRRWKYWWEWEEIITSILWFSVWRRGGEVGITAPVPPQYCESTLIDKATCWRGPSCWQDLRRLFTEELVWSGARSPSCMEKTCPLMSLSFSSFPLIPVFSPNGCLLLLCAWHTFIWTSGDNVAVKRLRQFLTDAQSWFKCSLGRFSTSPDWSQLNHAGLCHHMLHGAVSRCENNIGVKGKRLTGLFNTWSVLCGILMWPASANNSHKHMAAHLFFNSLPSWSINVRYDGWGCSWAGRYVVCAECACVCLYTRAVTSMMTIRTFLTRMHVREEGISQTTARKRQQISFPN